jgi:hypothetical protein
MSERADGTPEPVSGATASGSSAPADPAPADTAPADTADTADTEPTPSSTTPPYATRPVAFRRPDVTAGLLLVLAGVATGIALLLPWLSDRDDSGLGLVRRGLDEMGHLGDTGFWQPLAVVFGGAALLLLGLLMFLPARTHRALGLVALLVTALAAAGVLVPIAQDNWSLRGFGIGFWFAVAVPVLGLLGSLKAAMTRSGSARQRGQLPSPR